jgi:hypothetical protein
MLRDERYRHGKLHESLAHPDIEWFGPGGAAISEEEWGVTKTLGLLLIDEDAAPLLAVALLFSAAEHDLEILMPKIVAPGSWHIEFASQNQPVLFAGEQVSLVGLSMMCLTYRAFERD